MATTVTNDMTPEEVAGALWDMLVLPYGEESVLERLNTCSQQDLSVLKLELLALRIYAVDWAARQVFGDSPARAAIMVNLMQTIRERNRDNPNFEGVPEALSSRIADFRKLESVGDGDSELFCQDVGAGFAEACCGGPNREAAAAGSAVFETTSTNVSDLLCDVRLVA